MTVNGFLGLLACQDIWKYELEFHGVFDKYRAKVTSVVPKIKDGKVLLVIYGNQYRDDDGEILERNF